MSKIQSELSTATGVKPKRGQDRQELILAIMAAVTALTDAEWEGLSKEAQDWFNAAADAKNAKKKTLPDFPDLEEEQEEEAPKATSRRGSSEKAEAKAPAGTKEIEADDVQKGMALRVVTKRGKDVSGTVTGVDDSGFTLKTGAGEEDDFDFSRVEKLIALDTGKGQEEEAADPIKVGATVTLTTKRDKVVTGKIVELDDEVIVLDVDGKDEEFSRDRVASIKPAGGKAEAPKSSRRGAAEDKGEDKGDEKEAKAPRAKNEGGVSIGQRIKELICDDLDATQADIAKALKKEGIEFKENTLNLNYVDAHKFITILKAKKMLK